MPQLDRLTFLDQILLMVIFFWAFYFFFRLVILPLIRMQVELRQYLLFELEGENKDGLVFAGLIHKSFLKLLSIFLGYLPNLVNALSITHLVNWNSIFVYKLLENNFFSNLLINLNYFFLRVKVLLAFLKVAESSLWVD
jgi:hypothetical protein